MQFLRFIFVGILNTIFGYGIYAILIFIGLHYALAALLATVLGVLFNFKTIGKLVFASSDNKLIGKFIMVYSVVYGVNVLSLYIFNLFEVSNYTAGAILILPLAFLGFFLNKTFVFYKKEVCLTQNNQNN